jgi:hypothetical protein
LPRSYPTAPNSIRPALRELDEEQLRSSRKERSFEMEQSRYTEEKTIRVLKQMQAGPRRRGHC